ncbi:MAG TPA: hypothetical protein VFZ53_12370 [Polyangiaceae bacterium]
MTPALRADALDHGFVEPCTLANVQESELECEVCASAVGSRECAERLAPRGFTKACRTHGTRAGWDEIWCARRRTPASPGPSQSHSDAALLVGGAVATLGAMVLVIRMLSGSPPKG